MFVYKLANDPRIQFDEQYCKIGVPVGKSGGSSNKYATHYNNTAVAKTKTFLRDNDEVLSRAELKFNVPKEILAALLYVETRHGNYLGDHNVASVYMSLAMADQPKYIEMNLKALREKHRNKSAKEFEALESKLMQRTETKASWAIDQLLALATIDSCCYDALEIHGSYAGAFGISQFIPESYVEWAIDGNNDSRVDLYTLDDAVFSAANYLKLHGWSNDPKDQYKAIWGYNHSDAYVKAIQKLARKIKA
jgi:membrane-bound lytic murein transglycosylase B